MFLRKRTFFWKLVYWVNHTVVFQNYFHNYSTNWQSWICNMDIHSVIWAFWTLIAILSTIVSLLFPELIGWLLGRMMNRMGPIRKHYLLISSVAVLIFVYIFLLLEPSPSSINSLFILFSLSSLLSLSISSFIFFIIFPPFYYPPD